MANDRSLTVSKKTTEALAQYCTKILEATNASSNFRDRLDKIDVAYARYVSALDAKDQSGIDSYGKEKAGVMPSMVNPVVISQVQSVAAYLTDVFLSGYPIFPVVSSPENRQQAEALEGIIQDHLTLSESVPEIQLLIQAAARYNLCATEVSWAPVKIYSPSTQLEQLETGEARQKPNYRHVNKIKNIPLRNLHWDRRVEISKVDSEGDFIGYTRLVSRIALKDHLNYLTNENKLSYKAAPNQALGSAATCYETDYREDPILSRHYEGSYARRGETNWDVFGGWESPNTEGLKRVPDNGKGNYLLHTFYLKIIPSDFMLDVPNKNTVQVWKVEMVNRDTIISVQPYDTAGGRLGIFMSPCIEDGLDVQTQSYGEMAIPIQESTTRMFNARFHSMRRAIGDRALYNPDLVRASDVNNPNPSAKIPVKAVALAENSLGSAYASIPFDARGTEGVVQDAMLINSWAEDLSGINKAMRGQFTKGNRTMAEFDSIMDNSQNRIRLPGLVLEHRLFSKIKEQIKLNILISGEDTTVISPRSNKPIETSIQELQKLQLKFEMADGYTPKSKIANTEFLSNLLVLIGNSPNLQQVYGQQLPAMVAHLATLGGVRGFDQYSETAAAEFQKSMEVQMQIQQLMQQLTQQLQAGQQAQAEGQQPVATQ